MSQWLTSSQSSSLNSVLGFLLWIPAQLIKISIFPSFNSKAFGKTSLTDLESDRSATTVECFWPWSVGSGLKAGWASEEEEAWGRTTKQMMQPAWARAKATAAPIPLVPPVMRAFFPVREKREVELMEGVGERDGSVEVILEVERETWLLNGDMTVKRNQESQRRLTFIDKDPRGQRVGRIREWGWAGGDWKRRRIGSNLMNVHSSVLRRWVWFPLDELVLAREKRERERMVVKWREDEFTSTIKTSKSPIMKIGNFERKDKKNTVEKWVCLWDWIDLTENLKEGIKNWKIGIQRAGGRDWELWIESAGGLKGNRESGCRRRLTP